LNIYNKGNHIRLGLYINGQHRSLRDGPAFLLHLLAHNPDGMTHDEIRNKAWPALAASADRHVCRLRLLGVAIETTEHQGQNADGGKTSYRYRLAEAVEILLVCVETPEKGWSFQMESTDRDKVKDSPTLGFVTTIVMANVRKMEALEAMKASATTH
jgi:hypothetical protein